MRYLVRGLLLVGALLSVVPAGGQAQGTSSEATGSGPSWSGVRIETTEGWAYRDVTLQIDEAAGTALLVRPDGAERTIPLAQIAAVFSAEGENITAQIFPQMGAAPGAGGPGQVGEIGGTAGAVAGQRRSGAASGPMPRLFKVAPSLGIGYGFPLGGFYEGVDPGLSFHAGLKAMMSDAAFIDFVFRSTNIFSQTIVFTNEYGGPVPISADLDVRQYLVMFGYMGRSVEGNITRGYFEAGGGWADHVVSASGGGESASDSVGRFVFAAQGGMFVPFGKSGVGLDFSVHALAKFIAKEPNEDPGFIFGGQVGFVVFVGGD